MSSDDRRRRGLPVLALAVLVGVVSAPAGWLVTDHLERDNDFCNACHLEPGVPLHRDIRRDFDTLTVSTLAGFHAASRRDDPSDPFRCIECHGGVGFIGRARIKLLAAKDAFWYVTRQFDEPGSMRWPLWDEDCSQCHAHFDTGESEAWELPRFHQLPVHNVELGVDCVECHRVHEVGGDPEAQFLQRHWVRSQCARCHPEFEGDEEER